MTYCKMSSSDVFVAQSLQTFLTCAPREVIHEMFHILNCGFEIK